MPASAAICAQRRELRGAAEDRADDLAGQHAVPRLEAIGLVAGEARGRGHPLGEEGEAAGDQRGLRALSRHRPHQRPRARVQPHPLGVAAAEHARGQALQERDAGDQRRLEVELALHRRLGDRRHLRFQPGEVGELVDALDADDRRVHVGDQHPLAPPLGRHGVEVDAGQREILGQRPRHRHLDRAARQPARRAAGGAGRGLGRRVGHAGCGGQHQDLCHLSRWRGGPARAGAASRRRGRRARAPGRR